MSSKRQLATHDGADNPIAKRQHLELFPDSTSSTLDGSTTGEKANSGWCIDYTDTSSPSNRSSEPQPICFGTLCEVHVKPTDFLNAGSALQPNANQCLETGASEFFLLDIYLQESTYGFAIPNANTFVMIDLITAEKLNILEETSVFTKAVVEARILRQLSRTAKKSFEISVNIYGRELDARDIGQQLSKVGAFLQHPFYLEDGVEYLNPQFFDLEDGPRYMTHLVGMDDSKFQAKKFSDAVEVSWTSLDHGMPALAINDLDIIVTDDLITPLQDHQKVALLFIQRRENSEYCQQVARELLFHTRIASHNAIPTFALGGILADVMGLGKTLTILVSIHLARLAAENFQIVNTAVGMDQPNYPRTSATLVVVTSTREFPSRQTNGHPSLTRHLKRLWRSGDLKFQGKELVP
ncbi:Ff.00g012220.m01.CDS01 [Fusarium sp. VM40]|nr:Ff.00g012220.m01.CDS01 [Fusarium sp. VM40]